MLNLYFNTGVSSALYQPPDGWFQFDYVLNLTKGTETQYAGSSSTITAMLREEYLSVDSGDEVPV